MSGGDMSSCPVGRTLERHAAPCATLLQPRPDGQLVDGIAAHLVTVHQLEEPAARAAALRHLAGGAAS